MVRGPFSNSLLAEINLVIPKLNLTRQDVHYTYAGTQPVSRDPKDPKGTRRIRILDLSTDCCYEQNQ